MLSSISILVPTAALSTIAPQATAQTAYLVFPIPGIPEEAVSSSLTDVSDDGVCTGVWFDANGRPTAFSWVLDDSDPEVIGYTDDGVWWEKEPGDINADGHWAKNTSKLRSGYSNSLVSIASPNNGVVRTPAYWIPGAPEFSIGHLGGERGASRGVSDAAEAVGWSETGALDTHGNRIVAGFVWNATDAMSQLAGIPAFEHFSANDIHPDLDITVGTAWNWPGPVSPTKLPPLGTEMHTAASSAVIINAGISEPLDDRLPPLSVWHITGANAINSHQWIAGSAHDTDGAIRAVLVVPNKADTDHDGLITPNDFSVYLRHYLSNESVADLDGDDVINMVDVECYIEHYKAGRGGGTADTLRTDGPGTPPRRVPVNGIRANSSNC